MDEEKVPLKTNIIRGAIAVLGSIALIQLVNYINSPHVPAPSETRLLLGPQATDEIIKIQPIQLQDLNGMTHNDILELRKSAIAQHPNLFEKPYEPSEFIFEKIKDGIGWYGLKGFFVTGPGESSTEGISSEGRFILNPFLLVAPEFWGISIWGAKNLKWDMARVTSSVMADKQFPFAPKAEGLEWHAKERYAEVRYNVSDFMRRVNEWTTNPMSVANLDFGIVAYNASDMNLSHIYLDLERSTNISNAKQPEYPVEIFEHLGDAGQLCGVTEGCNHRIAPVAEFDSIKVKALPAKVVFDLWDDENDDFEVPTFSFIIKLE